MSRLLSYEKKDTWIHRLSGVTKMLFFLLWCIVSAMTYDTRILLLMIAVSFLIFRMAKVRWEQVCSEPRHDFPDFTVSGLRHLSVPHSHDAPVCRL